MSYYLTVLSLAFSYFQRFARQRPYVMQYRLQLLFVEKKDSRT